MLVNRKALVVALTLFVLLSVVLGVVLTVTLRGNKVSKDSKASDKGDAAKVGLDADASGEGSLKGSQERIKYEREQLVGTEMGVKLRDAMMDGMITQVKSDLLTYCDDTLAFFLGVEAEAAGTSPGYHVEKLFDTDAYRLTELVVKQIPELKKIREGFYKAEMPKLECEEAKALKPEELEEALKELPFKVAIVLQRAYDYKVSYEQLVRRLGRLSSSAENSSARSLGEMSDKLSNACRNVTAALEEILELVIRHWNTHDPQFGENFKQVLDWLLLFRSEEGLFNLRRWIVLFGDWLTGYVQTHRNDPLVEKFRTHVLRWTAQSIVSSRNRTRSSNTAEAIPASRTEYLHTQRIENFVIGMFTDFANLLGYVAHVLGVEALTSEVKLQRCALMIPTAVDIMGAFLDPFVLPRQDTATTEEDVLNELIAFVYKQYNVEISPSEYANKLEQAKLLRKHMVVLSRNLNFLRPFFIQYTRQLFA